MLEARADLQQRRDSLASVVASMDRTLAAMDEYLGVVPMPHRGRPIEYILAYLKRVDRPVERNELAQAMVDAGAGAGRSDALKQMQVSITQSSKLGKKFRTIRIVQRGELELVGLKEWGDEKFKPKD